MPHLSRRLLLATTAAAATFAARPSQEAHAAGTITIAEIFDPPGLDPTVNSVDLVSTITSNVFDTLYAFDKDWKPAPLLAAGPAELAEGGT